MLLDPSRFPFIPTLEQHWRAIRAEVDALRGGDFVEWFDRGAYSTGWNVYGLVATIHEARDRLAPDVRVRCPRTLELLDAIAAVQLAAFSVLEPGAIVFPHVDLDTGAVRCHLGLRVPVGARLQVGDRELTWSEGRCLVFDQRRRHGAANESKEPRVVLLVDVERSAYGI